MAIKKVTVIIINLINISIKVRLNSIKNRGKDYNAVKMDKFIKENGIMIKKMDMDY